MESHLLQMRGLKQIQKHFPKDHQESHLLQMRGLKLWQCLMQHIQYRVASFTDAWIETLFGGCTKIDLCRIFYRCVD